MISLFSYRQLERRGIDTISSVDRTLGECGVFFLSLEKPDVAPTLICWFVLWEIRRLSATAQQASAAGARVFLPFLILAAGSRGHIKINFDATAREMHARRKQRLD